MSGGQRQRTSLARAVYTNRDVYLLDDVLSAVDPHIGRWIFEKCINGYLKDKTRLFVTHQLQFVNQADYIVMMGNGTILEQGTYQELMNKENGNLRRLLDEHLTREKHDDEEEEEEELVKPSEKKEENVALVAAPDTAAADAKKEEKPAEEKKKNDGKLISQEERQSGNTALRVLWDYSMHIGGPITVPLLFIVFVIAQLGMVSADIWLSFWSSNRFGWLTWQQYLGIYGGIGGVSVVIIFFRDFALYSLGLVAAYKLHKAMFSRVIRAPMSFFDVRCKKTITLLTFLDDSSW